MFSATVGYFFCLLRSLIFCCRWVGISKRGELVFREYLDIQHIIFEYLNNAEVALLLLLLSSLSWQSMKMTDGDAAPVYRISLLLLVAAIPAWIDNVFCVPLSFLSCCC